MEHVCIIRDICRDAEPARPAAHAGGRVTHRGGHGGRQEREGDENDQRDGGITLTDCWFQVIDAMPGVLVKGEDGSLKKIVTPGVDMPLPDFKPEPTR